MSQKIKKIIAWSVPILILLALVYYIPNVFAYFDPLGLCYINIHGDILNGDEGSIKKALKKIKKDDPNAYKDVCKYVNHIYERECRGSDWHLGELRGVNEPGCYIKGSEAIYVFSSQDLSRQSIQKRAEIIKKYSQASKNFWAN